MDFKKLKDAIIEAGVVVENSLSPYIDSPTTPKGSKKNFVCQQRVM